ncbi:MAG: peptidoglycan-associated lipoprotein Pal [Dongiaceae bacterium]
MSYDQLLSGRSALLPAALLSLGLLAGCQSSAGTEPKSSEVASTDSSAGAAIGAAPSELDFKARLLNVGDRVHFELDRYELTPEAQATLRQQAALLENNGQVAVTIEGHADERGTREYNLALGERRADSVRNYLVALGVPAERISVISYGKERPECVEATESCWAENRRGVTVANQ